MVAQTPLRRALTLAARYGNALENRPRMGGRAVEGTGLENRQAREGLVGSNPTPSATDTGTTRRFMIGYM